MAKYFSLNKNNGGEIHSKTPKILLARFLLIVGVGRLVEDANSPQSRYEKRKTFNSEVSL